MCIEPMAARSKHIYTDCLRGTTMKPGCKLRWRLLRVSAEEEDEAPKQSRAIVRKYQRLVQRRVRLVNLAKMLGDVGRTEKTEAEYGGNHAEACVQRHPAGSMAPGNTTQYLMSNVYEDMKADVESAPHEASAHLYDESLSPSSVSAALDADCQSCMDFQQRDFEEVFALTW